jgi:hypothetical protein
VRIVSEGDLLPEQAKEDQTGWLPRRPRQQHCRPIRHVEGVVGVQDRFAYPEGTKGR